MQPKHASSRFLLPPLSPLQVQEFRRLGQGLLKQAQEECEVSAQDVDLHWKYVRTHQGLKVYKARPTSVLSSELLVTGIVHGTLSDVMQCVYADDNFHFRMHSALLMPKEYLDAEVLHAMDTQDDAHPFRFNGLKWCATKWPGNAMNKHRDLCYFEATGIAQAADKSTFGYHILESFDLAACGHLDDLSIVRAKVSIRHIFRELPIGCTMVMTHASIDPCGTLSSWMSDGSALPHLLAVASAADVAESIRLTKRLYNSVGSTSPTATEWRMFHAVCCLCQRDHGKLHKRRVLEPANGGSLRATKRHFCANCLANVPLTKPVTLVPLPPSSDALSRLSSLCLSEYSVEDKRTLPILDFDRDDDGDGEGDEESVYSGLAFDLRSTVQSQADLNDVAPLEELDVEVDAEPAMRSKEILGHQLAALTARMDETLSLLRRNKPQVDFCRSHGRVEYL